MKKIMYALTIVAAVALATSCEKEKEPGNENPIEEQGFFTFSVIDLASDNATIVTTASDTTTLFYCDVLSKEDYETYESDSALTQDYVDYINESVDFYQNLGYEVSFVDFLYHGVDEYTYNLMASTDYYAFAFRVTEDGKVIGGVEKKLFRTTDVVPSDIKFAIALDTITADSINLVITPSNDDDYLAYLFSESELAEYETDQEALFEYEASYQVWGYSLITNGESYFTLNSWVEESGKQILLVAGYAGGFTTDITRFEFNFDVDDSSEVSANRVMRKSMRKQTIAKPLKLRK